LFSDINVSQDSVSTHAMFGGIPNKHLTANLQQNLRVKEFGKKGQDLTE